MNEIIRLSSIFQSLGDALDQKSSGEGQKFVLLDHQLRWWLRLLMATLFSIICAICMIICVYGELHWVSCWYVILSLFWRVTTKLRYYPKDYVQELMAEAVSFLLRNANTSSEQLKKGIFLHNFDSPAPWKHIFLWSLKLLTLHCFNCDIKYCVCALFCTFFWAAI